MKSKKIIALVVALAAFMAMATSGLAAVSTQTTYNISTEKVAIKTTVDGLAEGQMVTYLVKGVADEQVAGTDIAYIDQKTADNTKKVEFDYKVNKTALKDGTTLDVKFGTNGTAIADAPANVAFSAITGTGTGATYKFYKEQDCTTEYAAITGTEDVVYVQFTPETGKKMKSFNGAAGDGLVYALDKGVSTFTFETEDAVSTPTIEVVTVEGYINADNGVTKFIKISGAVDAVGVEYKDTFYKAYTANNIESVATAAGVYGVRLEVDAGQEAIVEADVRACYKLGSETKYAN